MEWNNTNISIFAGIFLFGAILAVIILPYAFSTDQVIFLTTENGGIPTSCAPANGLVLAQNLTDLCDVVIITPITNQVIAYNGSFWVNANISAVDDTICANLGSGAQVYKDGECNFRTIVGSPDISVVQNLNEIVIDFNGTSGGDTTACINVGTGTAYSCVEGTNINLRSLLAGSGITVTNNTNTITITNSLPESTTCNNVGTGNQLCSGDNVNIDTLIAGTGITISDTTDDWTFASQCANTGTGEAVCESSNNINSLIAGTSISISDTTGDLTITNTSPDNTVCFNVGSGLGVYNSGECSFNSLIGGTGVTITDTTDDLTFASQCANTGTGEAICESANNINSLIAGTGISISDTTGDLTIASKTVFIVKTADETVNNSAVLQNDNHLSFSVDANSVYFFQSSIRMAIKATSDFKYVFTVPVGATATGNGVSASTNTWSGGATISVDETDLTTTQTLLTTANRNTIYAPISAYVITGANAGTVQFQWAQNTATAEDTTLKTGSIFIVTKLI